MVNECYDSATWSLLLTLDNCNWNCSNSTHKVKIWCHSIEIFRCSVFCYCCLYFFLPSIARKTRSQWTNESTASTVSIAHTICQITAEQSKIKGVPLSERWALSKHICKSKFVNWCVHKCTQMALFPASISVLFHKWRDGNTIICCCIHDIVAGDIVSGSLSAMYFNYIWQRWDWGRIFQIEVAVILLIVISKPKKICTNFTETAIIFVWHTPVCLQQHTHTL